jgi:putative ABC transport system ATP-binding protein
MTSTKPILELKNVTTIVNAHTPAAKAILKQLNLKIYPGDFITVLGPNGAGKSTFFNSIAGTLPVDSGQVLLQGKDITRLSVEKRAKFISRVFQDPKMGTAPRMTVAENLLLATKRGKARGLKLRGLKAKLATLQAQVSSMNNGLAERMQTATESLSGGQRQALSFLMATIERPDLLLLDEHTAALDPKN